MNDIEQELRVTIRPLDRERIWILELGTVYPYGLNDRLQSVGNVSKNMKNTTNVFGLLNKPKRRKRSHGRRRNKVSMSKIMLENLYSIFNKETRRRSTSSVDDSLWHSVIHIIPECELL